MNLALLDGHTFESLVEELLTAMSFAVTSRPAIGPDRGCDLIAERYACDDMGLTLQETWLVQCKNNSNSGKSVKEKDLGNLETKMQMHDANRYLLVTATSPSETVKQLFQTLNKNKNSGRKATFWHQHDIARQLERFPNIRNRYFPWVEEAIRVCEHICGDHRLFSVHRGVMAWGEMTAVYGNDGYDPQLGQPVSQWTLRTRRQVDIFLNSSKKAGIRKLAFAKSCTGTTWVTLMGTSNKQVLEEFLVAAYWQAHHEIFEK